MTVRYQHKPFMTVGLIISRKFGISFILSWQSCGTLTRQYTKTSSVGWSMTNGAMWTP